MRAFVHVHAAGQRCSGDFFKELSERFANLEPGAKEHYIELGKIGADLHRLREKSFGARKRRRIERQPLRALPAPERDADEDEADGAEAGREEDADMTAVVVARDAEALPEAGQRGISFIEEEAQQVQSSYRHAEHAQRQAAIADEAFLQEHSNNLPSAWALRPWGVAPPPSRRTARGCGGTCRRSQIASGNHVRG